jgi:FtsP/CotA-like multicopper oxidase with cupredoxin domain
MWVDVIVEYIAGFALGLFVFQALFMKSMMGGAYWENVRNSFMPEFISMNAMMAGMIPVMATLMMGNDMRAMWPGELLFWGVMSLGVGVGFAVAYPFNVWLVSKGLKHGLMTQRAKPAGMGAMQAGGAMPADHSQHMAMPSGHAHHEGQPEAKPAHADHMAMAKKSTGHEQHTSGLSPAFAPTRTQIAAVAAFATIMLAAGFVYPFTKVNMSLSAHDVGGAIMPPGMIMSFDTPGDAMRDMAAVDPRVITQTVPPDVAGGQILEPRMDGDTKVFEMSASVVKWSILPDEDVAAYAYNNQVPGPTIRVTQGDKVRIDFKNQLPESTTIHWHGLILPNEMDGPANVTQAPIEPGESFTYEYETVQSGTYFYHTHDKSDRQQSLGLYGALIIDPKDSNDTITADVEYTMQLQEWLKREWLTFPAMPMEGALPNFFTINGKSYPATDAIKMTAGQTLKVRFLGTHTTTTHPMHIHGGPFEVVAIDGETLAETARYKADTVNVAPGQRYDVIWTALRPGKWLVHCHIPHHTTNNNEEVNGGGGLTLVIDVAA